MEKLSNRERVLKLILAEPGLTDSEICHRTGIEPHQQVNQICRGLASAGLTKRTTDPSGRIVNIPITGTPGSEIRQSAPAGPKGGHTAQASLFRSRRTQPEPITQSIEPVDFSDCLVVISCSSAKRAGGTARTGTSVLDFLPNDLADELSGCRRRNQKAARVDESTLLPAFERYDGSLYTAGRSGITRLTDQGARVLIVSGGYGLVLANESIGMYEQIFRPAMWPNRLVERCLAALAQESGVRTVIGVVSASTGYATVFRRTQWPGQLEHVIFASPESTTGAMVKTPRAQGEWLTAIAQKGDLPQAWSSSDGLRMEVALL